MNYKHKFDKYKQKIVNLRKKLVGGEIIENNILSYIVSIGFEFETTQLHPVFVDNISNTIGTPIANYDEKEKIMLERIDDPDNFFDDIPISTFEITPDFGSSVGRLQEHLKLPYDGTQFFRCIFDETESNKINYNIISYYDKYKMMSNAEFVVTFYKLHPTINIIIEKFIESCKTIVKYIENLKKNTFKLQLYEGSMLVIDNMKITFDTFQHVDPKGNTNYLCLLNDAEDQSIVYKPQVTIGVHIDNVVKVISYLLENTKIFYGKNTCFNHSEINAESINCENGVDYHEAFIKCEIEVAFLIMSIEDISNQKEFENWLILAFFNYFCYTKYLNEFAKIINETDRENTYFKMYCPILVRHKYTETCPLIPDDKLKIINMLNALTSDDIESYEHITQKSIEYIKLLLDEIEQFENNIISPPLYTTMYDYDRDKKIILFEYRDFGYEIARLLNNTIRRDSLTYDQMISLST
jgi:hypothetical protein